MSLWIILNYIIHYDYIINYIMTDLDLKYQIEKHIVELYTKYVIVWYKWHTMCSYKVLSSCETEMYEPHVLSM